jgi:hypothetical protein
MKNHKVTGNPEGCTHTDTLLHTTPKEIPPIPITRWNSITKNSTNYLAIMILNNAWGYINFNSLF